MGRKKKREKKKLLLLCLLVGILELVTVISSQIFQNFLQYSYRTHALWEKNVCIPMLEGKSS